MIDTRRLAIAAAIACLVLAGCQKKAAEGNKATGEVLEGTISDSMIATDQTRVEPPLAPHAANTDDKKAGKAKAAREGAGKGEPSAEPSSSPTPESSPAPKPTASESVG